MIIDVILFIAIMYCIIAFLGRMCYEEDMDDDEFIDV